jgi:gluconate kinase
MIKFLFGKAGSGKSHIGEAASRSYGFHYHDADQDLPESFRKAIERGGGVTEEMREEYIAILIATVKRLAAAHPNVCIGQAMVRDRTRLRLLEAVPSVEFVWVDAPDNLILSRVESRPDHLASREYAQMVNRLFEVPTVPHAKFINDGDPARFAEQMRAIFGDQAALA